MNNKARYDEFYYKKDQKIHSIDELLNEYEFGDEFLYEYKGFMYCPECIQARLKFTPETSKRCGFLSTIPGEEHTEGCSYCYNYASKRVVENIVREWSNCEINDKLSAAMRMLLDTKKTDDTDSIRQNNSASPVVISIRKPDGTCHNASIPRKSLSASLDESIQEIPYLFYGRKVKLANKKMVSRTGWEYNMLDILTYGRKQQWKYKVTIYRGQIFDEIDEEKEYRLVLYGVLQYKYGYPQINLLRNNAIRFDLLG